MSGTSWFALATYRRGDRLAPALAISDRLYDLDAAARADGAGSGPEWADGGIGGILSRWEEVQSSVRKFAEAAEALTRAGKLDPVRDGERLLAAPLRPERIFCAASNYIEHANEMGTVLAGKSESKPYMFLKLRNTVIGPGDTIRMPPETTQLDWEIELAAVIGRRCRRVPVERALDAVAGYTIVNDISARDLNVRDDYPFKFDWFQGKCHDTFAPLGPWIVPAWQIPDPQAVHMRLAVNDAVMQDDTTRNMIWTVREQIAYLSTIVTLEPGDIIATGTPTGVGMGRGVYLKHGDTIAATIDGIGTLTNPVAAEGR
jgi:2-keto-4-pentenoate hydratase/2-oxohepta-3-ene-1,7-dioic acid hydratase in catechol pathway